MKDHGGADASVIDVLKRHAEARPDRLACGLVGTECALLERHSYESFLHRVQSISAELVTRSDIPPGARVLLVFPPGTEMLAALFACADAGVIAVPVAPVSVLDRGAALERIACVAADCAASAVLCGRVCKAECDNATTEEASPTLAVAASLPWIVSEDIPNRPHPAPGRAPNTILMLQYTSGSTNRPRGVIVEQANILANRDMFVDHADPVVVSWLPQHHDMGLIGGGLYPLLSGGTTYGMTPSSFIQRPALWLRAMSQFRATASAAPNFAYDLCADPRRVPNRVLDTLDLSSIRLLAMSAEPVRPESYLRFLSRYERTGLDTHSVVAAYGLAENTLVVSSHGRRAVSFDKRALAEGTVRPVEHAHQVTGAIRLMSCGFPLEGNDLRIVDPETRVERPAGTLGEIWVRGAATCRGYWNAPESTRTSFEVALATDDGDGGFLRTGDLGFLFQGELFVSGRIKDLIIVRGRNFAPQDIEAAAEEALSGLRSGGSAAVSTDIGDAEPLVSLVAEVRPGQPVDPRSVLRAVRQRTGLELDRVVLVPRRSIPKTTSGKTMRFEVARRLDAGLFEILSEHRTPRQETVPAQTLIEEMKARYQLSGDEDCTAMDAGFDSLDLVVLMHEIRDQISTLGWERIADQIDVSIVQRVTIRDLMTLLERSHETPTDELLELPRVLRSLRATQLEAEAARMRADIALYDRLPGIHAGKPARDDDILLTGATGFLGPHLLDQLLQQTGRSVIALVRGASAAEATERLAADAATHGLDATVKAIRQGDRVSVVPGDLSQDRMGLDAATWAALSENTGLIVHNGAVVNYLKTYEKMRGANVLGTLEALRLSRTARPKRVVHLSTMFVFGWQVLDRVLETDRNPSMSGVDFGYSQSKWVSEQIVHRAGDDGQPVQILRPAFLAPTQDGRGLGLDITLRLFAFMLKHGIGIEATNEFSILPVDFAARRICGIALDDGVEERSFHVTRDDGVAIGTLTPIMEELTGRRFQRFPVRDFVPEVIRRCTPDDPFYPLVDFFIHYVDRIVDTEHKRYDNRFFCAADPGDPCPAFRDTVSGMLRYLRARGLA